VRAKPSAMRASHGRRAHASRQQTHVGFDMGSSSGEGSSDMVDTSANKVAGLKKHS